MYTFVWLLQWTIQRKQLCLVLNLDENEYCWKTNKTTNGTAGRNWSCFSILQSTASTVTRSFSCYLTDVLNIHCCSKWGVASLFQYIKIGADLVVPLTKLLVSRKILRKSQLQADFSKTEMMFSQLSVILGLILFSTAVSKSKLSFSEILNLARQCMLKLCFLLFHVFTQQNYHGVKFRSSKLKFTISFHRRQHQRILDTKGLWFKLPNERQSVDDLVEACGPREPWLQKRDHHGDGERTWDRQTTLPQNAFLLQDRALFTVAGDYSRIADFATG